MARSTSSRASRLVLPLVLCSLSMALHAQERATLVLQSEPGAEVLWQGVRLGTIEDDGWLSIRNVPAGDFEIRLSKAGYRYRVESIRIEGSRRVTRAFPLQALQPEAAAEEVVGAAEVERPEPPPIEPRVATLEPDVAGLPTQEEAAAALEPVAQPESSSSSTLVLLVLAAVGALLWLFRHRLPFPRPTLEPTLPAEPERPTWDPAPPESPDTPEPQDLLREIRRRERDRQDESQGRPKIIEAEFVEFSNPEEGT